MVGSLDFETIGLLGANLGLGDLDQVAELNKLCNDIGVDTMETGAALGVLAEGGLFAFGDFPRVRGLIREIGQGTPLGRLIGSGAAACGRAYGLDRVPTVKGQSMAAYDPRVIKGMGLTYALSPMGADHTAGNAITLAVDPTDPAGAAGGGAGAALEIHGPGHPGDVHLHGAGLAGQPGADRAGRPGHHRLGGQLGRAAGAGPDGSCAGSGTSTAGPGSPPPTTACPPSCCAKPSRPTARCSTCRRRIWIPSTISTGKGSHDSRLQPPPAAS